MTMNSLRKTKELVVAALENATRLAAARPMSMFSRPAAPRFDSAPHSRGADTPVRVPVPHRSCGNQQLARRCGAKRTQRFERTRLSQTAEKRSIRIRASLQRCRGRRKINSAFRRCALQYEFFGNGFQPRRQIWIFDPSPRRDQTSRPRSRQLPEVFDLDASPNRMYDRRNPRCACPRHAGIPAKEMAAMTSKERFSRASGPLLLFVLILPFASTASAEWNEKVLYSFQGIPDGAVPAGGVVFDKQGNLYGATGDGGASTCEGPGQCGTVYQLKPPTQKGGAWAETVLYVFKGHAQNDGATPEGGLVIDQAGNLYGVTGYGGSGPCLLLGGAVGCGTVYKLSPPAKQGDPWKEKVLYSFQGGKDGYVAFGDLVFDKAGNLYGATLFGGGKGTTCDSLYGGQCGTVFKLSPPKTKGGKWTEKVLHRFAGGTDGANPNGGLVLDSKGRFTELRLSAATSYATLGMGISVAVSYSGCRRRLMERDGPKA